MVRLGSSILGLRAMSIFVPSLMEAPCSVTLQKPSTTSRITVENYGDSPRKSDRRSLSSVASVPPYRDPAGDEYVDRLGERGAAARAASGLGPARTANLFHCHRNSNVYLYTVANSRNKTVRIEIYLTGGRSKYWFDELTNHKELIEKNLGYPLDWDYKEGWQSHRVYIS